MNIWAKKKNLKYSDHATDKFYANKFKEIHEDDLITGLKYQSYQPGFLNCIDPSPSLRRSLRRVTSSTSFRHWWHVGFGLILTKFEFAFSVISARIYERIWFFSYILFLCYLSPPLSPYPDSFSLSLSTHLLSYLIQKRILKYFSLFFKLISTEVLHNI